MERIEWSRFSREVLALYEPPIRARTTQIKIAQVLREFGALIEFVEDLTPQTIGTWIQNHPGRSPSTSDSLLRSLSAAILIARAQGYLDRDPIAWRKQWLRLEPREVQILSQAQIRRCLDQADIESIRAGFRAKRLRAILYLAAYTGARKREILCARREDIDLNHNIFMIRSTSKNRLKTKASAATIPIAPDARWVISEWIKGCPSDWMFPGEKLRGPWIGGEPGHRAVDALKALGARVGVEGLTFQVLRHSFATHAAAWGLGEVMLRRILRHTTIRTQAHYLHTDLEDLDRIVRMIQY